MLCPARYLHWCLLLHTLSFVIFQPGPGLTQGQKRLSSNPATLTCYDAVSLHSHLYLARNRLSVLPTSSVFWVACDLGLGESPSDGGRSERNLRQVPMSL